MESIASKSLSSLWKRAAFQADILTAGNPTAHQTHSIGRSLVCFSSFPVYGLVPLLPLSLPGIFALLSLFRMFYHCVLDTSTCHFSFVHRTLLHCFIYVFSPNHRRLNPRSSLSRQYSTNKQHSSHWLISHDPPVSTSPALELQGARHHVKLFSLFKTNLIVCI